MYAECYTCYYKQIPLLKVGQVVFFGTLFTHFRLFVDGRRRWRWMRMTVLSWPGGSVKSGHCVSSPDCLNGESRAALMSPDGGFVLIRWPSLCSGLTCSYGSPGNVTKEYYEFANFFLKTYAVGIQQVCTL